MVDLPVVDGGSLPEFQRFLDFSSPGVDPAWSPFDLGV